MKKIKKSKLNFEKVSILEFNNLKVIKGGNTGVPVIDWTIIIDQLSTRICEEEDQKTK